MSNGLKIFLWILLVLAVLAAIAFFWAKNAIDKIAFSAPVLTGLDLKGITLNDLAKIALEGTQKEVQATLAMGISNSNNFSIPFGNLGFTMYYNGTIIAQTSPSLYNKKFVLPANGSVAISDTINIVLNTEGAKLREFSCWHTQNSSTAFRPKGRLIPIRSCPETGM